MATIQQSLTQGAYLQLYRAAPFQGSCPQLLECGTYPGEMLQPRELEYQEVAC